MQKAPVFRGFLANRNSNAVHLKDRLGDIETTDLETVITDFPAGEYKNSSG
jgi:hypothetical protein